MVKEECQCEAERDDRVGINLSSGNLITEYSHVIIIFASLNISVIADSKMNTWIKTLCICKDL